MCHSSAEGSDTTNLKLLRTKDLPGAASYFSKQMGMHVGRYFVRSWPCTGVAYKVTYVCTLVSCCAAPQRCRTSFGIPAARGRAPGGEATIRSCCITWHNLVWRHLATESNNVLTAHLVVLEHTSSAMQVESNCGEDLLLSAVVPAWDRAGQRGSHHSGVVVTHERWGRDGRSPGPPG